MSSSTPLFAKPLVGQPLPVHGLMAYSTQVLATAGLTPAEAACAAESLVQADMRGVNSHGLMRLRTYAERVRRGVIRPGVTPQITRGRTAFFAVDGGNGMGMPVARQIMSMCIVRARQAGASFATVDNGNHFGIAAYFTEIAAQEGMIGIAMSNAPATMVPTGGRKPLLGANPLSIAVPCGKYPPLILDMATSTVAQGKIILAAKEGKTEIPNDWAVDSEGRPTTDPQKALQGAMLPFGGAKGYGLALVVDILSSVLSGALTSLHINHFWKDFERPQKLGYFLGAWDISAVMPLDEFTQRMEVLIGEIKASPPAPNHREVFYPGEIEHRRATEATRSGVLLGPAVVEDLCALGQEYGAQFPAPMVESSPTIPVSPLIPTQ